MMMSNQWHDYEQHLQDKDPETIFKDSRFAKMRCGPPI